MSKTLVTALATALLAGAVVAEDTNAPPSSRHDDRSDITTLGGVTYERCKILRTEPDGLVVMHARGIAKLPFGELPEELSQEHAVSLPWFIDPQVAARYWPESIQDVLDLIDPENASAEADLKQAVRMLESPREYDMAHWYRRFGSQYAYVEGKLLSLGADLLHVRGKVLSIADDSTVLVIDDEGDVVACRLPATDGLVDGEYFSALGRPIGTYRYTSVIGATKQVRNYEWTPSISLEDFMKLGEEAFPEIADAKRVAHQRLIDAERTARQRLHNAGRGTYEQLLADKVREEATHARARAVAAARDAQDREAKRLEDEEARRQRGAERAEQARRAAAARREKFRLKGPEDFR